MQEYQIYFAEFAIVYIYSAIYIFDNVKAIYRNEFCIVIISCLFTVI